MLRDEVAARWREDACCVARLEALVVTLRDEVRSNRSQRVDDFVGQLTFQNRLICILCEISLELATRWREDACSVARLEALVETLQDEVRLHLTQCRKSILPRNRQLTLYYY